MLAGLRPGSLLQRRRQRGADRGRHHQEDGQHEEVLRLVHPECVDGWSEEVVQQHEGQPRGHQRGPQMADDLGRHDRQQIEERGNRGGSVRDERGQAGNKSRPRHRHDSAPQAEGPGWSGQEPSEAVRHRLSGPDSA